ncbi:Cullin binding-domain-containing protein [Cercophora newfieldiana]|uniref:Defective in cullin neddylation protein n=1 Tax=Cercophora newfieldiana TaxID=92897 RepID=A0AA40CRV7_9PEZI|nr:Cullin binding-domain-containing protein [Cercophora newfieldiana]
MFNSLRGRSSPTAHTAEDASTNKDKGESEDDSIGVESIDQYTRLLGVNMYNFEFFVLCEILQPGTLGQISRKEFVNGWKNQTRSPGVPLEPSMDEHKKFIRSRIQQLPRDPVLFKKVYRQTFMSGKESHQKAIPKEVAITFWDELFSPTLRPWKTAKVDWLDAWERYLADNWKRSVNKDMWNQTLEFAIKTMEDETLSFWTENQAWPGVIDDFVVWCREEGVVASPKKNADGMEVDE